MNRCDECKHKDGCVCVPYGCECFEIDLEKHNAKVRESAIDECIKMVTDEKLCLELEKMKEQCSTYTATVDGVKREFM